MLSFVGPPVARKWAPASNNYVGSCAGSCTCTSTSPSLPWAKTYTILARPQKKIKKMGFAETLAKKKYAVSLKKHHLGPQPPLQMADPGHHRCPMSAEAMATCRTRFGACHGTRVLCMLSHGRPKVHEAWRTKCWKHSPRENTWVSWEI